MIEIFSYNKFYDTFMVRSITEQRKHLRFLTQSPFKNKKYASKRENIVPAFCSLLALVVFVLIENILNSYQMNYTINKLSNNAILKGTLSNNGTIIPEH